MPPPPSLASKIIESLNRDFERQLDREVEGEFASQGGIRIRKVRIRFERRPKNTADMTRYRITKGKKQNGLETKR